MGRDPRRSALRELRGLAGLLETGLLALHDAGVAGQQTGLLQSRAVGLFVDLVERAGHAEAQGAGLTSGAATVDARDHVEAALELQLGERLVGDLLVQLVREVVVERAAVDPPLAGARDDAHAGDGLLATTGRRAGRDRGRTGRGVRGGVALGRVARRRRWSRRSPRPRWCSQSSVRPQSSLGDLRDLEGSGLLGQVRVVGAGVDLELLQDLATELVLGEHAPDSVLDGLASVLLEELADGRGREAAREAGVAVGHLGGLLGPRQRHLGGVHDDHEVAHVHVRGEGRLVLAAEEVGGLDGEASEDHVGGVDDEPLTLDVSGLGAVRAHGDVPFWFVGPGPRTRTGGGAATSDEHGPDRSLLRRDDVRICTRSGPPWGGSGRGRSRDQQEYGARARAVKTTEAGSQRPIRREKTWTSASSSSGGGAPIASLSEAKTTVRPSPEASNP